MATRTRMLVVIAALAVSGSVAGVIALTGALGPTEWGLRCARAPTAACVIEQTRFFGVFGNSAFSIPEERIRGAKTVAPRAGHVGGRGGAAYSVALVLEPTAPYRVYPVLSYAREAEAEAATARLEAYLRDRSQAAIVIEDSPFTDFLPMLGGFALFAGALWCLRWLRFRRP